MYLRYHLHMFYVQRKKRHKKTLPEAIAQHQTLLTLMNWCLLTLSGEVGPFIESIRLTCDRN